VRMDRVAAAVAAFSPIRLVGVNYNTQTIQVYVAAPVVAGIASQDTGASVLETERAA